MSTKKPSVSWRINSSPHPPITVIVTGRRPSFMKIACQSFFPGPTQMTETHTRKHTHTLCHYRSATDQLSCWIPNRIYPINLPHTGITDWYRGKGEPQPRQNRPATGTVLHNVKARKTDWKLWLRKTQMPSWKERKSHYQKTHFISWSQTSAQVSQKDINHRQTDEHLKPIIHVKPVWNNGHYNGHMHSGKLEITRPSPSRSISSLQRSR